MTAPRPSTEPPPTGLPPAAPLPTPEQIDAAIRAAATTEGESARLDNLSKLHRI